MAKNIEIKAYLHQFEHCLQVAKTLANTSGEIIEQEDIFFHSNTGRLKLRIFDQNHGQLIFYQRDNLSGPKSSHYEISTTSEPQQLKTVLANAYPIRGIVKKIRTLYLIGRTRLHLDQVDGLGNFIELEVVMQEAESPETGIAEAHDLMQKLGIDQADLIDCAYIDLLEQKVGAMP